MTEIPIKSDKSTLRHEMRARRTGIERRQRQAWAAQLNQHLLAMPLVKTAQRVAGYLAFDGEPDIRFALTQLHRRGIEVYLPVVAEGPEPLLHFRRWSPATPLQANRYGISEPVGTRSEALETMQIVLAPLVAWDRCGRRLGMGGGYYDRTLAALPADHQVSSVGIAWSAQEVGELPEESWDQRMHAMVLETGWFTCPV